MWVGPANKNSNIPVSIQEDMAEALAMTLSTARVDCKVSKNIRQQQFERVIGYVTLANVLDVWNKRRWPNISDPIGPLRFIPPAFYSTQLRIVRCSKRRVCVSLFLTSSMNLSPSQMPRGVHCHLLSKKIQSRSKLNKQTTRASCGRTIWHGGRWRLRLTSARQSSLHRAPALRYLESRRCTPFFTT